MNGNSHNGATEHFDFATLGFSALREALDACLEDCETQISKAEIAAAVDELVDSEFSEENGEIFLDFALYLSSPDGDEQGRPIDRIAKKLAKSSKPVEAAIALALPGAAFSLFEFKQAKPDGAILVGDLLDGRECLVMDDELAAASEPGAFFAARLVELGPWHLPVSNILTLRKSETVTVLVMGSMTSNLAEKRALLENLVYTCEICEIDLVRAALDPLVESLAQFLDASPQDVQVLATQFEAMLPKEEDDQDEADES
ncbi:MAG: hypothetical protein ACLPID_06255 [Beijerinckiaceae bacterium]